MITTGIKEAKNNLSRYLARVKAGEEVVITERGKPVARIVREGERKRTVRATLAPLIGRGLITAPIRELNRDQTSPVPAPGSPVSDMVIEDRR